MKIGIPTEMKTAEKRVALTPKACQTLVESGHEVFIQKGAGEGAGFTDETYVASGVNIEPTADSLFAAAEMIVKVKEPQQEELSRLRKDHLLFCYLHLAAEPALTKGLQDIGLKAVAFETVEEDGKTPLLAPMSAVAGRLSVQIGTWFLHAPRGGLGVLMGGIDALQQGHVVVIGAGVAGQEAAHLAYHMGAKVTLLDINQERLDMMAQRYPGMHCEMSTPERITQLMPETSLLVGAVYVIGKRAPNVVTEEQIKLMPQGSVAVDISIDQGGCIATSRPCTHDMPVYTQHGVIHSAITNLPGSVPLTSSQALSQAILPYVQQLADGEWTPALEKGINVDGGELKIAL